jgi:FkbM family methyltransferase
LFDTVGSLDDDFRVWGYALRHGARAARAMVRRHRLHTRPPADFTTRGVRLSLADSWATPAVRADVYDGRYESGEAAVLLATATDSDRILDIGCGAGFVTTLASRIAEAVWGYEANPAMVAVSRRTLMANGQDAEIINAVLQIAPRAAEVEFYVRKDFTTSSLVGTPEATCVSVPALDFAAEVTARRASYLIIDIEGAETELLQAHLPACVSKISVECHPVVTGQSAVSTMLAALLAQGFTLDLDVSEFPVLFLRR